MGGEAYYVFTNDWAVPKNWDMKMVELKKKGEREEGIPIIYSLQRKIEK